MVALNLLNDSKYWQGKETIQYFAKSTEAVPSNGVPVEGTLWLMIKKDMLPPSSPLIGMDLTVEIPGRIVGPLLIVPKTGDVMQRGDGSRWVIKQVEIPAGVDYRVSVVRGTK